MAWLTYWHWLALALLLFIAETLGAAGLLVALGMAAALTGFAVMILQISWEWQLIGFSILCVAFALGWWFLLKQHSIKTPGLLNRPMEALIGTTVSLYEPIVNGRGKIRYNDANWFVTGPDLPAGSRVKITGIHHEGSLLIVEPV